MKKSAAASRRDQKLNNKLIQWLDGDLDPMEDILDETKKPDITREQFKQRKRELKEQVNDNKKAQEVILAERKGFYLLYRIVAIVSCIILIGVLLFVVSNLPLYGQENPRTVEVVQRYVEDGLEETGAINIVSGMILDYRAFDTLGESHVLFTALVCVMILLGKDQKNMQRQYEDYYTIQKDQYYEIHKDRIIRLVARVLLPCILLYGIYILLNGQLSPGGGFSGGAVLGAGMIIFAIAFGFETVDRFFTLNVSKRITFLALAFYSFAKGYVFVTGANGIDNMIPKGTPGAILSGGLILPLDIAVGIVVACTMFGFYSLFKRGSIGHD